MTGTAMTSPTRGSRSATPADEDVARLAVAPDEVDRLAAAHAVGDGGLEALAVERDLEVVAHAAVDGDEGARAALDRDDAVERHARARDEAAPGLDDQPGLRRQVLARGADEHVEVLGHASAGGRRRCSARRARRRGRRRRTRRARRAPRPPARRVRRRGSASRCGRAARRGAGGPSRAGARSPPARRRAPGRTSSRPGRSPPRRGCRGARRGSRARARPARRSPGAPGDRRRRGCRPRRCPRRPRSRATGPRRSSRCRAGRCARDRRPRPARGPARRRRRRRSPGPPRRARAAPPCRGRPWRRRWPARRASAPLSSSRYSRARSRSAPSSTT